MRAVIHTELPFLLSKEFLSVQENAPYNSKTADAGHSHNSAADAHRAKWNVLFDQMDRTLSEEEKQLVGWLQMLVSFIRKIFQNHKYVCRVGVIIQHDIHAHRLQVQ